MHSHYMLARHGLKMCAKCHDDKRVYAFGFDRSRPDGRHVYCKECRHEEYETKKKILDLPDVL